MTLFRVIEEITTSISHFLCVLNEHSIDHLRNDLSLTEVLGTFKFVNHFISSYVVILLYCENYLWYYRVRVIHP